MKTIAKGIVKLRYIIVIASIALMIPCFAGMAATRVNYDILTYLPGDIETMKGQDILEEEFGTGAFSMLVTEHMPDKDVAALKARVEQVEHVKKVLWYDSFIDYSIPKEMLPDDVTKILSSQDGDAQLLFVIFDETTSADGTLEAVSNIRKVTGESAFLAGMSGIVLDTKELAEKETPIYVGIAVALAVVVLSLTMDSFLIPLFFLASIGVAIMLNLGTNIFFGEISFITKSLAAVLQLGVTLDYSIFLWHSYQEEQAKEPGDKNAAMARAITSTFQSVIGSSITTVAGFIALCFMSFTLGLDLGLVMAKGVLFGVICCVTVLPSMILVFDPVIEKTRHRPLLREFDRIPRFIADHAHAFLIIFLCLLPFAVYGYTHTAVYYDLADTLPAQLPSIEAMDRQNAHFDTSTSYMVLMDKDIPASDVHKMVDKIKKLDGIGSVVGAESLLGSNFPKEMLPDDIVSELESDQYTLLLITTDYNTASDEVNAQIEGVNTIVKEVDPDAMVVGEAPCTKDLITITAHDFNVVSWVSIGAVFFIILFVMKSVSLPFILVAVIEFAIFINMGIPAYTGAVIPFISSVVIGTIQLGATVDYAILMTTRYCRERQGGKDKRESTRIALSTSMKSVIVSALSFFAATFGVGLTSSIDMIGSLCFLMARGALISMAVVLLVLPSMYMLFDGVITRTTMGMGGKNTMIRKNLIKSAAVMTAFVMAFNIMACGSVNTASQQETVTEQENLLDAAEDETEKETLKNVLKAAGVDAFTEDDYGKSETVYVNSEADGSVSDVVVSNWLKNPEARDRLEDVTGLKDIVNTKGDGEYSENGGRLTWDAEGSDVYYQGSTDKELPVDMKVTYTLDGREITPAELAGKSGKVTIRFDYNNRSKQTVKINGKDEVIYTPFTMISGVMLDSDKFANVTVSSGKVIADADRFVVVGYAMPGMNESLNISDEKLEEMELEREDVDIPDHVEITAYTSDFEMPMTITFASADMLSGLKTDGITKKLDKADADMDELTDGSKKLVDGTKDLADGADKLYDGSDSLADGAGQLRDGIKELYDGTDELKDGAVRLKDGTGKLAQGAGELANGTQKLYDGSGELKNGMEQLYTGTGKLADGVKQYADGAKQFSDGAESLGAGAVDLGAGMSSFAEGASQLTDGIAQLKQGSSRLAAAYQGESGVLEGAASLKAGADELAGGASQVSDGVGKLVGMLSSQTSGYSQAAAALGSNYQRLLSDSPAAISGIQSQLAQALSGTVTASMSRGIKTAAFEEEEEEEYDEPTLQDIQEDQDIDESVLDGIDSDITEFAAAGADETVAAALGISAAQWNELVGAYDAFYGYYNAYKADPSGEGATGSLISAMGYAPAAATAVTMAQSLYNTASGMSSMAGGDLAKLRQGAESVASGAAGLSQGAERLSGGLQQLSQGTAELDNGLTQLSQASSQLAAGSEKLSSGISEFNKGTAKLKGGADELSKNTGAIKGGADELQNGMAKMVNGTDQLMGGIGQVNNGAAELSKGAAELDSGAGDFAGGIDRLHDGAGQLMDGAAELADGAGELKNGVGELKDGADELHDGMVKFDEEGIQKLADLFGDDLKGFTDRLNAITEAGDAYRTFSGADESEPSNVKFIIKTAAVEAAK